ncbi:O7E24 protein, partial [Crocuta crocuta]
NLTSVSEFFLMGLSDNPGLQPLLFGIFLSMYLVGVLGNLLIILVVSSDSHLHTPMYFFLSNLSLADIGFISTTVPKMIVDIQTQSRVISYVGCLTQMSFLILFGCMDGMLLTAMAYDRFVAICHPLHYSVIMNPRLCGFLVLVSFFVSLLDSQLHNLIVCLCSVEPQNLTDVLEFLLLGFSDDPELQPLTFSLFLSMYLVTMLGNLLITLAISSDSHLHTPMYVFLSILSLADIGFTSTTVPKVIWDIQTHNRVISHAGCLIQLSFFYLFGCLDSVLLTVMAYDRFVAVCYPLHYPVIMNPRLCRLLILLSFLISLLDSLLQCLIMSQLTFCTNVEIPNFFCDPPQLLKLSCNDTSTNKIFMYFIGAIFGGIPVSGILFSYTQIVSSILRLPSTGGRYRAFSTCGSHLSVVC